MQTLCTYVPPKMAGSFSQRLCLVRAAGFDGVCLNMTEDGLAGAFGALADATRAAGLAISNAHLIGAGAHELWRAGKAGEAVLARTLREMRVCAAAGVPTAVMHVTWGTHTPPAISQLGIDRFLRMAEEAEKLALNLALENSVSAAHLYAVLTAVNSPRVGLCYDSGHHHCFAPEARFLEDFGPRLMAMHLQDNDGSGDMHLLPFDGTIDWPTLVQKLARTALFRREIALEPGRHARYEALDDRAYLARAAQAARRLAARFAQEEERA